MLEPDGCGDYAKTIRRLQDGQIWVRPWLLVVYGPCQIVDNGDVTYVRRQWRMGLVGWEM